MYKKIGLDDIFSSFILSNIYSYIFTICCSEIIAHFLNEFLQR